MWSAVPGVEDLSSGSGSDEEKSANSADESSLAEITPDASNVSLSNNARAPPRGVCKQHWQTFCKLKRRREESVEAESKGRPKKQKKKRRAVFSDQTDEASFFPSTSAVQDGEGLSTGNSRTASKPLADSKSSEGPRPTQEEQEHWDTLKKHLTVNDHIHQGIDHGQYNPHKSGLEKELDKAVEEGDFDQAEELSNRLATRDLACKIAKSSNARDYLKWKQAEETRKKAKRKKKKLNWGFEAKERWQMKGNM